MCRSFLICFVILFGLAYGQIAYRPTNVIQTAEWLFENRTRQSIKPGICFMEVETTTLIKNTRAPIPRGNGTEPHLSRIQVCCEGYERNARVYYKCDPICRNGCINGICVAPDTCTCYPGNVLNEDGYCVSTLQNK